MSRWTGACKHLATPSVQGCVKRAIVKIISSCSHHFGVVPKDLAYARDVNVRVSELRTPGGDGENLSDVWSAEGG